MQRSSSLFQSRLKQAQGKSPEQAKLGEPPPSQAETTEFSSEFTNQDSSLSSEGKSDSVKSWEDIIEDDDWLTEEEDEEDEGEPHAYAGEAYDEEEDESAAEPPPPEGKPPAKRGGFKSSFGSTAPSPVTQKSAKTEDPVKGKLGFEWGPVQERKGPPPTPTESAEPTPEPHTPVPFGATRKVGWKVSPSDPVTVARPRPPAMQILPPRGQLKHVEPAVVQAARLLMVTPEGEPGYGECIRLLSRFGLGALRLCSKARVKVHILDEEGFIKFPELVDMGLNAEDLPVDGAYLVKSKSCLIDRRCLTEKPRFFHPALYYFAHALDHAQGGDDFSSRKAAAVRACYEASCEGLHGCDFVDELAAADPVRYFARSVAIYLGRDDCEEPIWTHQDLYDFDRSMYEYLQYLFARFA